MPHDGEEANRKRKRRFGWDNLTYTTRVTMAFAFVAAMTALVAIGVLSFVWEQHFQAYTQTNMETLAQATARQIEEIYEDTDGTLENNEQVRSAAQYAALLNSVGVLAKWSTTPPTLPAAKPAVRTATSRTIAGRSRLRATRPPSRTSWWTTWPSAP